MKTLLCLSLSLVCLTLTRADVPAPGPFAFTDPETGITETRSWNGPTWRAEFHDAKGKQLYIVGGPWKMEGIDPRPDLNRLSEGIQNKILERYMQQRETATYVEKVVYASVEDPKLTHMNEVRRYRIVNTNVMEKIKGAITSTDSKGVVIKQDMSQNKVTATMLCPLTAVTGRNYKLAPKS